MLKAFETETRLYTTSAHPNSGLQSVKSVIVFNQLPWCAAFSKVSEFVDGHFTE
jgi:hypothetical protein